MNARTVSSVFAMLLLSAAALSASAAAAPASTPAQWRLWLGQVPARSGSSAPTIVRTASVAADAAWIERWARTPPSLPWNDIALELVVKYQQNPLRAARMLALLHASLHDALVMCARQQCSPAATRVAMHAAAGHVLAHMYPDETPGRLQALAASACAAVLVGRADSFDDAWRVGRSVAAAAIDRALDDGADRLRQIPVRPAERAGLWRAAPPLNIYNPAEANAAHWRTWALESAGEIEAPPPIEYGTAAYSEQVEEIRRVASALTPAQMKIAEEWDLGLGTVTPGGVWNLHARRIALEQRLDTAETARLFAALNVAMTDAFAAAWHAKFKWWTERPITVIREKLDPAFLSHVITPAFPGYVSGHATVSGAASAVLSAFFPDRADELAAMAEEAAMSRLYAGIHFRNDNEAGLELGRRVGARVTSKVLAAP
jgi:hypothetical protein